MSPERPHRIIPCDASSIFIRMFGHNIAQTDSESSLHLPDASHASMAATRPTILFAQATSAVTGVPCRLSWTNLRADKRRR